MRSRIERIVIISDDCVESGGAAGVAIESARMLRSLGFPVTFLTGDDGANPSLEAAGIDIVALGGSNLLEGSRMRAALRGLYDSRAYALLQSWISANDTPGTIYHLHNWHKVLSPSAFPALEKIGPRLFLTAHDYFLTCPNGGYSNFPKNAPCDLVPMSKNCLLSNCDKRHYGHKLWRVARHTVRAYLYDLSRSEATILAVSEAMVPLLERGGIPRTAIRVLRNPVRPWCSTRIEAERNRHVFYVGRLELDKGVDVLAEAARIAGAPLTVVGDGPLKSKLAAEYPEIRLTGRLNKSELGNCVQQARLLVMPTRWRETFGLVAAEALMCGIPVIASTLAPISDDIAQNGFGLTCRPGDATALAEQLRDLMKNDALIAEMSKKAYSGSRTLAPQPEQWRDQLVQLYQEKLQRSQQCTVALHADARAISA